MDSNVTHYNLSIRLQGRTTGEDQSDLMIRWMEFWCAENCTDPWTVEETDVGVNIKFGNAQDMMMFKLSPEFVY